MSDETILFTFTIPNERLKQILKLKKIMVNSQLILTKQYFILCGTNDHPNTMEICRVTQLLDYQIHPDYQTPKTFQAIHLDLEKLDNMIFPSGLTTITRYQSHPDHLDISQQKARTFQGSGDQDETSTLFEIQSVSDEDKEDLSDFVLCWDKECVKGISARDFDKICKQIIGLKLPEETLLKFLMKKDHMIIDYNNELGSKIYMRCNKPERWMELDELNESSDDEEQTQDQEREDGLQINKEKQHTASYCDSDKEHSIEIAWPHFVKYIQCVKIGSEVRFYIYKKNPILMLEVMLSEVKSGSRVEYGSLRLIIKQGAHDLPTVGSKFVKSKSKKKPGRKRKADVLEEDSNE